MSGSVFQPPTHSLTTLCCVACDLTRIVVLVSRPRRALAVVNLLSAQRTRVVSRAQGDHGAVDDARIVGECENMSLHVVPVEESQHIWPPNIGPGGTESPMAVLIGAAKNRIDLCSEIFAVPIWASLLRT
jgi:hypothetical protein